VLLDACLRLVERGFDFRCILVGDGRERPALERACADPRLRERVKMLGARNRSEVRQVIAEAHVVVLPCLVAPGGRADGIPVALMEAMALQRPVVSTTVSGIPELVEDCLSGLLVAPDDAVALADALERLLADPAHAARLAAAGRRRIEEAFDLDRNVARLGAFFEAEAGGGRPARAEAVAAELRTGTG
jgi:glycosyltransferase involved in cell wall biosynthesis